MIQCRTNFNIVLMIFNLIPVPPLDGFNIVAQATKFNESPWFDSVYSKGPVILILLLVTNITGYILRPGISAVSHVINSLMGILF